MNKLNQILSGLCAFFSIQPLVAEASSEAKQYDAFAQQYSDVFVENNQDSITAYYRYLDIPLKDKSVLDLGCGDGYDLSQIHPIGALVYGIDASEEMVKLAQQKNPDGVIKVGLFEEIPFEDHRFDIVISKWAFQTSPNIDPIYHEVARILKPNGQFIYLSCHPMRQFIEKKRKGKNYFKKEIVESVFFDGQITAHEPSHTLNEYLSPTFFKHFTLESYEEGNDSGAEKVDGDIYPSYFIIKARLKDPMSTN
jgi:ubiquinone/menaquinone biosynthesis C-methylase UbiE